MRPSRTRAVQLALHIVPGAVVALAAVTALATRTPNPIGARLYGGPPGSDETLAWRVVVLERDHGYYAGVPGVPLRMEASARGKTTSCEGTADAEGAWEARVALPALDVDELQVSVYVDRIAQPAVAGTVPVRPSSWKEAFKKGGVRVDGDRSGALKVALLMMRGALSAGFPERAVVQVTSDSDEPVPQSRVQIAGEGFSATPAGELVTDARGEARVRLLPTHNSPRVEIHATTGVGSEGTWEGVLPVMSGTMWVDPDAMTRGRLLVRSPVPHQKAYLTFFTEHARLLATQMTLSPVPGGGAMGEMQLPPLPQGQVWVLPSPDPQGQGMEAFQVGWPVVPPGQGEDPEPSPSAIMHTPLLADGIPTAVLAVRKDERAARARILALLAIGAFVESVLLFVRARQARGELRAILALQSDIDEAMLHAMAGGEHFWLKLVLAAALIAGVFGAVALLLWMQI